MDILIFFTLFTPVTTGFFLGKVESIFCTNQPVSKHYNLGQLLGVTGTPAIFTQTGSHIKGYVPPEDLLKRIKG